MKSIALVIAAFLISTCQAFNLLDDEYDFRMGHLLVTKPPENGKIWAVLVAGSKEWFNYRHQADICHAYQVLHRHGVPDDQIIVMMYDDIANSENNPTPGVVINHPAGDDVYHGVKKDYTGEEVNPQNFLDVLTGNKEALRGTGSGKVLESTENDNVFVYFADHGAPGLIAMPAGAPPLVHARDLIGALQTMADQKMFAKLVFYMEACESGSMFSQLPNSLNIYAVTAANATESSYACYFDQDRGTFLGDTFSVNWMEDSDKENIATESLETQYEIIKSETNSSHVEQFGDLSLSSLAVAEFQGTEDSFAIEYPYYPLGEVPSPDVPLEQLSRQLQGATDSVAIASLQQQIANLKQKRARLDEAVNAILATVALDETSFIQLTNGVQEISNYDCYETVSEAFHECISFTENNYALRQLYKFVNACEAYGDAQRIVAAIRESCTFSGMTGIH